ncbi:MAG: helix-turn-helix transcriptional regulator [Frankiaceae bacterium]|nr:helix-turn-helix transcriptional regulator [Frankiaceae bacterium]
MEDADQVARTLLLRARRRRQWSQAELARRAGLPPSQLCAYETGAKQPAVATLARILAVAGVDLASAGTTSERERQARELEDVLGLVDAMQVRPPSERPRFGPFKQLISP